MFIVLILLLLFWVGWIFLLEVDNRNEVMSFECGFNSRKVLCKPFSVRFYLAGLVFLVFDVEIAIMFPMVYYYSFFSVINSFYILLILFIIIFGFFYEWKEGTLDW